MEDYSIKGVAEDWLACLDFNNILSSNNNHLSTIMHFTRFPDFRQMKNMYWQYVLTMDVQVIWLI